MGILTAIARLNPVDTSCLRGSVRHITTFLPGHSGPTRRSDSHYCGFYRAQKLLTARNLPGGRFGFSFEAEKSVACLLGAMPVTILFFDNQPPVARCGSRNIAPSHGNRCPRRNSLINARVVLLVAATVGRKRNDEFVRQHQRPGLNLFFVLQSNDQYCTNSVSIEPYLQH